MAAKTILLTIDVEDWFQVENFKDHIDFSDWESLEWRFEKNINALLDIFKQYNIKATFFVLGWNAERAPELIKKIHSQGHEVASHGYNHDLCTSMDGDSLFKDLSQSKTVLEGIIGTEVKGYRAPSFSISDNVIKLLKRAGYQYDSSYDSSAINSRHGTVSLEHYQKSGIAYSDQDGFSELPISNLQAGSMKIPWGGGGYFRLIPKSIFNSGVSNILKKDQGYMFYTHPWEFDPDQPRVSQASASNRFRHYINLKHTENKLRYLIENFSDSDFMTCQDYLSTRKQIA